MIRIDQIKLPLDHPPEALEDAILSRLRIPRSQLIRHSLVKRSIDARRQERIQLIYSVDVEVLEETSLFRTSSASEMKTTNGISFPR